LPSIHLQLRQLYLLAFRAASAGWRAKPVDSSYPLPLILQLAPNFYLKLDLGGILNQVLPLISSWQEKVAEVS